jgi:hypothetical protein
MELRLLYLETLADRGVGHTSASSVYYLRNFQSYNFVKLQLGLESKLTTTCAFLK